MKKLFADRWRNTRGETIVEDHYRLTIAEAEAEIEQALNESWLRRCIRRAEALGGWVKEIRKRVVRDGQLNRTWVNYSPRPYVQGYGCDGTTDRCIHLVAFTLAQRLGLDYAALYTEVYGDVEEGVWWSEYLETARVETFVPGEIDPLLVLDDMMDINNYRLARRLGEELIRLGLAPKNWGYVRSGPAFEARKRKALLNVLGPARSTGAEDDQVRSD